MYVQTVNPSAHTFQACTYGIGACSTFTYGGSTDTYWYDPADTGGCQNDSLCDYAITEARFASGGPGLRLSWGFVHRESSVTLVRCH